MSLVYTMNKSLSGISAYLIITLGIGEKLNLGFLSQVLTNLRDGEHNLHDAVHVTVKFVV